MPPNQSAGGVFTGAEKGNFRAGPGENWATVSPKLSQAPWCQRKRSMLWAWGHERGSSLSRQDDEAHRNSWSRNRDRRILSV